MVWVVGGWGVFVCEGWVEGRGGVEARGDEATLGGGGETHVAQKPSKALRSSLGARLPAPSGGGGHASSSVLNVRYHLDGETRRDR